MNSGKILPKVLIVLAVLIVLGTVGALLYADIVQGRRLKNEKENSYGVFLGIENDEIAKLEAYKTVVIDPQYFTQEDIAALHEAGKTVFAYINVGSLETFRSYYEDYSRLSIGSYENWEEEIWIDVSNHSWMEFINTQTQNFAAMGVDGFFADNCDVYWYVTEGAGQGRADSAAVRESLKTMLWQMRTTGKKVIVNGADSFVSYCIKNEKDLKRIFTGVNQETVLTSIDFEKNSFGRSSKEDREYFTEYLEKCGKAGLSVYLLEYATDSIIKDEIKKFCEKNGYSYYIAKSKELN